MKYNIGDIVVGKVTGITKYGVFVLLEDGYTGMIHISEISYNYVKDINEYINIDDELEVRVINIDENQKRLQLSMKDVKDIVMLSKNTKIKETKHGFSTLRHNLPIWIDKNIKNIRTFY